MELRATNSFFTVLCASVLVLCPLVRGGCQERLMHNPDALKCIMGISTYITGGADLNELSTHVAGKTNFSDPAVISKMLCSPKGKSAFSCIIGYLKDCPELMSGAGGAGLSMNALVEIPGFDLQMVMTEGLDGICALLVGPCSEVTKCFAIPQGGAGSTVVKGAASVSTNKYMFFQTLSGAMCGTMKEQMTCMLKVLEKCPASLVKYAETEFEKAMTVGMPGTHGVSSFQDTKRFIQNECPKMPKDFSENTCAKDVFVSQTFTTCNDKVAAKYSQKRNCEVHDMSKQCINANVQPKCGEEIAELLTRNTHLIFPGIPDNCERKVESGSDRTHSSFGLLLITTVLALQYIL